MEAQKGVEVQLYSFFNIGAKWGWAVNATPRPLNPQEKDAVPTVQEAGWAAAPVWTGRKILTLTEIHPRNLQSVSRRYIIWFFKSRRADAT
jgi:hypothetical protein